MNPCAFGSLDLAFYLEACIWSHPDCHLCTVPQGRVLLLEEVQDEEKSLVLQELTIWAGEFGMDIVLGSISVLSQVCSVILFLSEVSV